MTRAEDLAAELEQAYHEFADHAGSITPEQWRAIAANNPEVVRGEDERRPVSVVAHHVGDMLPMLMERARRLAAGEVLPPMTLVDIDAMNAKHASANRSPNQAETVSLIRDNASRAAALVRGLTDHQLDRAREGGGGALTTERFIRRIVIGHATWHHGSVRATVES